ncbi:hypothetical protein [Modestobacter italicus]|uniref:hypothetical protein n=1 Tax=Modestobacter italicus (strain DSM 44449 / CECT 9708 / BC 501) TaxID=2732864 RepID=UPI001C94D841|nr:hypothetical protein [Modestobacter italicus]
MSSAPDRSAAHRSAPDRTERDRSDGDRAEGDRSELDRSVRAGLRRSIADGRWPLFALELVVLAVVFGWLFLTVAATGGNLPW